MSLPQDAVRLMKMRLYSRSWDRLIGAKDSATRVAV